MTTLPITVIERWNEAIAKGDLRTWRACMEIADAEANVIERNDPDNIMVPALRGICAAARACYFDLCRPRNRTKDRT